MEKIKKSMKLMCIIKHLRHTMWKNLEIEEDKPKLTHPQGLAVAALYDKGPMKISDLSAELALSNSTVSGIVDRLEKLGILERTRSTKDRRIVYVKITDESKGYVKKHREDMEERMEFFLSHGTDEEVEEILHGLETFRIVLQRTTEDIEKREKQKSKVEKKGERHDTIS